MCYIAKQLAIHGDYVSKINFRECTIRKYLYIAMCQSKILSDIFAL